MLTALLPAAPSFAATAKQRMETCKFGADDQKLKGPARKTFMAKCMSNKDDPRGPAHRPIGTAAAPDAAAAVSCSIRRLAWSFAAGWLVACGPKAYRLRPRSWLPQGLSALLCRARSPLTIAMTAGSSSFCAAMSSGWLTTLAMRSLASRNCCP